MKCFHGTTKKGLAAILSGDNHKPTSPWVCSDNDGAMYFYPIDKVISVNGLEDEYDDGPEQALMYAYESAFSSAMIQAVTSLETELYVITCEIPDELLEDDYSCENMADIASYIEQGEFSLGFIEEIHTVKINQYRLPYDAAMLLRNDLFNKWALDGDLLEMAEAIATTDMWLESIDYCDEMEVYEWRA